MKTDIIQQFNLPPYIKNKTFAEASKAIESKFKDRADKVSTETKKALMERLQQAQEYVKMQDALKNESQQIPDQMDGAIPQGMEQFMGAEQNQANLGAMFAVNPEAQAQLGAVQNAPAATMATPGMEGVGAAGAMAGDVAGTAMDVFNAGKAIFGDTGLDTSGAQKYDQKAFKAKNTADTVGGVATLGKGIATGNPMDIIAGGAQTLGAVFGRGRQLKEMRDANATANLADNAAIRQSDFAKGGKMTNKYENGGDPTDPMKPTWGGYDLNKILSERGTPLQATTQGDPFTPTVDMTGAGTALSSTMGDNKTMTGKGVDWLNNNLGTISQFAPVASNLLELKNLKKTNTQPGARLDNVYKPQMFDEAALQNTIRQQNTERALTESSGGDMGALRSNLIASGAAKTKALSDAQMQGEGINRAERQYAFQTGMDKDKTNIALNQDYLNRSAMDDAAYETTKSGLKRALAEDAAAIGREAQDKKLVRDMFGYKWDGSYYVDNKGNKVSTKEVQEKINSLKPEDKKKDKKSAKDDEVARLYKRKNALINRDLNFRTPGDSSYV